VQNIAGSNRATRWAGVVRRLQAEVDVFARLVQHHGEQGRENEAALARILEAFVPRRLGVGTGMVIDRFDRYARQADIVLFEQVDEPTVLAQTTQLIYPVESVRASIEVKTRLRSDDIRDCLRKRASLQELQPADGSSHPLFVLLAYDAQLAPQLIHEAFAAAPEDQRPDLYCVLEPGVIGGRRGALRGSDADFSSGLAFVRARAENGRRTGRLEVVPAEHTGESMLLDGQPHPVFSSGGVRHLGEPARALLLFVEALARQLAQQQKRPLPVVSHYLDDQTAELVWLRPRDYGSKLP